MEWAASLQSLPVLGALFGVVFLLLSGFLNGFKEKREGKKLGIEQQRQRNATASAKKDREIIERANYVKETSDAVRDTGDYSDERLPDETAAKLPDYHYRD